MTTIKAVDVSEIEKLKKVCDVMCGDSPHDVRIYNEAIDDVLSTLERSPSVSAPTIPEGYALDDAKIRDVFRLWKHLEETPIGLYKRFKDAEKAMLSANQGSDKS